MNIKTTFEPRFIKRSDGLYQENIYHYITFIDGDKSTKRLDKIMPGKLYREDNQFHSVNGEAVVTMEEDGITRRLIALGNDTYHIKPEK